MLVPALLREVLRDRAQEGGGCVDYPLHVRRDHAGLVEHVALRMRACLVALLERHGGRRGQRHEHQQANPAAKSESHLAQSRSVDACSGV